MTIDGFLFILLAGGKCFLEGNIVVVYILFLVKSFILTFFFLVTFDHLFLKTSEGTHG